jgi:hypothetical protein
MTSLASSEPLSTGKIQINLHIPVDFVFSDAIIGK